MENNFQGKEGESMPFMPDEFVDTITARYIELYERITGLTFDKDDCESLEKRIDNNVCSFLNQYIH